MDQDHELAELNLRCARLRRDTAAASVALSTYLFNRPDRRASLRGSEPYRHWLSCREQVAAMEARTDAPARRVRL
jgi:hypothetical protein